MNAEIVFSYQLESSGSTLLTAEEMPTIYNIKEMIRIAVLCQSGLCLCVNPVFNI